MGTPVQFKYAITTSASNEYYVADLLPDGTYDVYSVVVGIGDPIPYLKHLPKNWDKLEFEYIRNTQYFGVFRSESNTFQFADDGRAILQYIYLNFGIETVAKLRIDQRQDDALGGDPSTIWRYETVYYSELDFTSYVDDKKIELLNIKTYDGQLKALLEAYGDVEFNIPYFTRDEEDSWTTDATGMFMPGIKLPYMTTFISSATPDAPLTVYNNSTGDNSQMAMVPNNTVQFIGNDLLSNFIQQITQITRLPVTGFDNYTNDSGLIRYNGLVNGAGYLLFDFELTLDVASITYPNPTSGGFFEWDLTVFGINESNIAANTTIIAKIQFPNDPGVPDGDMITVTSPAITIINTSIPVYENQIQVIATQMTFSTSGATSVSTVFNALKFSFVAQHSTDLRYPGSPCLGFSPSVLFDKIVKRLNSTITDPNGFAVPDSLYSGISEYLTQVDYYYDAQPKSLIFTSGNALRNISGIQYITISLNGFFKAVFSILAVGLNISTTDGVQTGLEINYIRSYFAGEPILDLGANVANLKVSPLLENVGNILKTGYSTKWQDFSQYAGNQVAYYGVDAFNVEQDYKLPITKIRKDIDWTTSVIAEQYKIEAARAMQNESAASSPSSSNETYVVLVNDAPDGYYTFTTPSGEVTYSMEYYTPVQYEFAQDTDPTTPVYVRGMLFPETAMNLALSPAKCLLRKGNLLHSYLTGMDGKAINFMKQYWQLRNGNSNIELAGIATNLSGTLVTEVSDINISDLIAPLFNSYIYEFESNYPVNLYKILNETPYGLVSFNWMGTVYSGFIWEARQMMATQQVTTFKLVAAPASPI